MSFGATLSPKNEFPIQLNCNHNYIYIFVMVIIMLYRNHTTFINTKRVTRIVVRVDVGCIQCRVDKLQTWILESKSHLRLGLGKKRSELGKDWVLDQIIMQMFCDHYANRKRIPVTRMFPIKTYSFMQTNDSPQTIFSGKLQSYTTKMH